MSSATALAGPAPVKLGEVLVFDDSLANPRTRAEVRADVRQALGTGQLHYGDTAYPNFN